MAPAYRLVRPTRVPATAPVLDAAQQRVLEHRGGPLLVLAGPGTGKTTTLVEAAVARVRTGVPVENILMLTFSRRAAGELRDRITARLGRTVREPVARTLHSYAFGVLRMAHLAQRQPAPRLLSGPEQDVIMRELVAGHRADRWPTELRPALRTRAFSGELRDLLTRAVERGLDGPTLTALGGRRGRSDWVAAGAFLTEYQQVISLPTPGGFDPAELIRAALNTFTDDPALLASERARRRHIFVDEYQDTDPLQAELLAVLGGGAEELVVVGDPDQSIYAFRGADESAIRAVDERFGRGRRVPVVALAVSRRSGPALLAATRRLAARLPGSGQHRALSAGEPNAPGTFDVALLRTASEEAAYVAGALRRAHLDGMAWSRMAVLVRSTAAVLGTLRRALITAGVPVAVRGEDLPLAEQPAVAMLLEVLSCVLDRTALTEDIAERLLIGPIGGMDVVSLRRLRRVLRQASDPYVPVRLAPELDAIRAALLPAEVSRPVERVARVLAAGRAALAGGTPEDVLWAVWNATGLARRWQQASVAGGAAGAAGDRDLDAAVQLFDAAARFTDRLPGATVAQLTEHLRAQEIPGDAFASGAEEGDTVTILTAHASKGLEWDLVCVAHVQEGSWPDLRRRGSLLGSELLVDIVAGRESADVTSATQLAEERRLFYVAATRARRHLVVTAVSGDEEQPSRFLDELDPMDGERSLAEAHRGVHLAGLVAELRSVVCDPSADDDERQAAAVELTRLAAARIRGADPDEWWGLAALSDDGPVADPARPVPVSPSRIDSFLRCELRMLLQDLGARDSDTISASLGTLVHELAAEARPDAPVEELEAMLEQHWPGLDFGAAWFAKNERQRANRLLARLVQWLQTSRSELTLVEIERAFTVPVGDAALSGRVDRLERDEAGRLVVIDFKTGKKKATAAELPGHPQLGAYQLAIEAGAFGEGMHSGGARLVQLATTGDAEQRQQPLRDSDDPDWVGVTVAEMAARLRGSEFSATVNGYCGNCDLQNCCPLYPAGRQVTT
ncbi:MAG: ATP-dependent helicase [Actinomycetota bacterium]|nr:ATP-dependent helicase [Actinomycetota bacterium]